jgi:hypothetical protein
MEIYIILRTTCQKARTAGQRAKKPFSQNSLVKTDSIFPVRSPKRAGRLVATDEPLSTINESGILVPPMDSGWKTASFVPELADFEKCVF